MNKLPLIFKDVVRKKYFEMLKIFVEDEDLILDIENYKNDVIVDRKNRCILSGVIAIIDSHSVWGEPDNLIIERINRKYDGLKIIFLDEDYRGHAAKIAYKMQRNLEEDVIITYKDRYI